MSKILSVLTIFVSLGFSLVAGASDEKCMISNLRFDQNLRLYDFVVIEPDFSYVTSVVGYHRVNGNLQPAVGVGQEFRRGEKGFGLKTIYTSDKTLSQKTVQDKYVFSGKTKHESYSEDWELITNLDKKPMKLTRNVSLRGGSASTFVCDRPHTSAWEWYSLPFADTVIEYNAIPQLPTVDSEQ